MQAYQVELNNKLESELSGLYHSLSYEIDTIVVEVLPDHLAELCQKLHDDFGFKTLIDICGVDYAAFGEENWATDSATAQGFSRGVFDFGETEGAPGIKVESKMEKRYCAVYQLLDVFDNQRLRVKCYATDVTFPVIPSVVPVWACADWFEREAFDMLGIVFSGHPDLRRILTDYGFVGHPLRKDFPLTGKVEMYYDEAEKRVCYRPVTLENRVNIPRIIRTKTPKTES